MTDDEIDGIIAGMREEAETYGGTFERIYIALIVLRACRDAYLEMLRESGVIS